MQVKDEPLQLQIGAGASVLIWGRFPIHHHYQGQAPHWDLFQQSASFELDNHGELWNLFQ